MTKVHVLAGGNSPEREVSLRSGAAVAKALETAGFEVRTLDPAAASIDEMAQCDVVFPVLHGVGGEDGTLQAEFEAIGVPCVGSDSAASRLCFDKAKYRAAMLAEGLPMARGAVITHDKHHDHEIAQDLHVLKPVTGGSSIDTFIVRDLTKIPHDNIGQAFEKYGELLLEELIEGTELTVGILGSTPLPIIEIIPPAGGEFDYENKYNGETQELVAPQSVSGQIQKSAQQLALRAHELTGCQDISRTDIIVDKSGKLFLLETNTMPGMTDQSLYPKMAATAGITMPELCKQLVEMALSRSA